MKRVCVFAGSSSGARSQYGDAARKLGAALLARNLGLVYGGGAVGLMGLLADTVLEGGGHVIGVIPRPLVDREVAHTGLSELRVVASMHERKAQMTQLSDAFIALPGGLGTLEELFEIWTWAQLGIHRKPCGLLNAEGYYDHLLKFLDHAVAENFIEAKNRGMMTLASGGDALLDQLESYQDPEVPRWVEESET
jgi:uncharacterized protein (TIGR00730 family)